MGGGGVDPAVRCPNLIILVVESVLVDLHESQDKVEEDRP